MSLVPDYHITVDLAGSDQGVDIDSAVLNVQNIIIGDGWLTGPQGDPATNLIQSVNGRTGVVTGLAEATDLGTAAAADATDFATAAQGAKADTALQAETDPTVPTWAKTPSKPTYNKAEVGLPNVDNTSDASKPISTATQAALDAKATTAALDAHANSTTNPHQVTKAQVGLGNVDNTSDANKPVSTAQQTALDGKASKSGDTMTGPLEVRYNASGVSEFKLRGGSSDYQQTFRNGNGYLEWLFGVSTEEARFFALRLQNNAINFENGTRPVIVQGSAGFEVKANRTIMGGVYYISGTGFPEGITTAPVGSIYIDKAITNGASSWIKKSGTGSTGWQVLEGDTGWRNVTADFSAALTVANPNDYGVYIRRTNGTVQINIKAQSVYSAWAGQVVSLYSGFRLDNGSGTPVVVSEALQVAGTGRGQIQVGSNIIFVSSTGIATGTRLYCSVSGAARTSEPWPTTLPGVSA